MTNDVTTTTNNATTTNTTTRKRKSRATKQQPVVLITLAQCAREINRDPKIVRAFARRNVEKFEHMRVKNAHTRWVFNERDHDAIIELIKRAK